MVNTAMVESQESLTGSLIRFGILTVLLVGIFIAIIATGSVNSVVDNWSRYRCNPFIMPFAELFGYDSTENFQYCVRTMMQNQSGEMFSPIYSVLGQYSSSMGTIVNTINSFRKMLGNFKLSTDYFVNGVMAKIQALLFQIRMTFMRMQTLMGRVYGTMYSIIWMGTSAITAGTSLADNDLVNFMFEFCFAPSTLVYLESGELKEIRDIRVGDILKGKVIVTSTFRFSGEKTPMVRIGKDVLSAEHRVFWNTVWIPAHQHPSAIPTDSLPELVCLNVEGHKFFTAAGLHVADYDESSDPQAIADAQHIAESHLNGGYSGQGTADYSLGLDPDADIWMADETWRPLRTLQLGETVYGGAKVLGLVEEECKCIRNYGGVLVSNAQLVYLDGMWVRSENIVAATAVVNRRRNSLMSPKVPFVSIPRILRHLVTDIGAPLFLRNPAQKSPIVVRDYREAPIPDIETPYLTALGVAFADEN
jgi:hypothetical protein